MFVYPSTVVNYVRYPYDNCRDSETHVYSTKQCSKTCRHQYLISQCRCYNPRYSFNDDYNTHNKTLIHVHCDSSQSEKCVKNITSEHEAGRICSVECPLSYVETEFDIQSSYGSWPVEEQIGSTIQRFQDVLKTTGVFIPTDVYTGDNSLQKEYIRNNFVKLDVFYSQLNFLLIDNDVSYSWFTFLADVGGQASLWLGFSFLSVFKLIEFTVTVFQYKVYSSSNSRSSGKSKDTNEFLV